MDLWKQPVLLPACWPWGQAGATAGMTCGIESNIGIFSMTSAYHLSLIWFSKTKQNKTSTSGIISPPIPTSGTILPQLAWGSRLPILRPRSCPWRFLKAPDPPRRQRHKVKFMEATYTDTCKSPNWAQAADTWPVVLQWQERGGPSP